MFYTSYRKSPFQGFFCAHAFNETTLSINTFAKPFASKKDLIAKMRGHGLIIDDEKLAYWALERIGYYRFTGYCLPFQTTKNPLNPHQFHEGTRLENVLDLLAFDSELRNLLLSGLECLEIAIRTSICERMSGMHGTHWYTVSCAFSTGKQQAIMDEAARHLEFDLVKNGPYKQSKAVPKVREPFLSHYYGKYQQPSMPPGWMLRELASFGFWARTYDALMPKDRKQIAQAWRHPDGQRIDDELLASWLWSISILRNRCAHHMRICHQRFPFVPKLPDKNESKNWFYQKTDDLHTLAVIMHILIGNIDDRHCWQNRLRELFCRFACVDIEKATGFSLEGKNDWEQTSFWAYPGKTLVTTQS